MPTPVALALALSLVAASEVPQQATEPAPEATPKVRPLRLSWVDGAVTATAGSLYVGSELLKPQLGSSQCRLWCETTVNGLDAGARAAVRWPTSQLKLADTLSNAVAYAALPAALAGIDWYAAAASGDAGAVWGDALVIGESFVLAGVLNQTVKFTVGRERPYARDNLTNSPDAYLSFYSGHTTSAFTLTFAAGTVAELRGYKNAWLIWAVGIPLSLAVPYLRMAADMHYLTDVTVGALTGAAFGILVPLLHRPEEAKGAPHVLLLPTPNGAAMVGSF